MTPAAPGAAPAVDRAGLIAAIAAISVAGIGFGHSLPLFSILLERYAATDALIGFNAAAAGLSALIAAPFYPRLIARTGVRPFLLACLAGMICCYAGFYMAGDAIAWWFPLRFLFGVSAAGLFAASEIWITVLSPDRLRGRIIGIYSTALALGFALGPLFIRLFGTQGPTPFIVAGAIFLAAAIPILWAKPPPGAAKDAEHGFFGLIFRAPVTFLAASLFAGVEGAVLTFLPILAIERGWGEAAGADTVTIYGLGIVAFQLAIGRLADGIGAVRALIICGAVAVLGALALYLANLAEVRVGAYVILFVWGGAVAGLYTVGLVMLGAQTNDRNRAAANSGFVFMYAAGSIAGPALAGLVRGQFGVAGLDLAIVAVLLAYLAATVMRRRMALP